MLQGGLVSISFRDLTTDEVIKLVNKSKLAAIEWGGDIHVPHGNISIAKDVYKKCKEHNIVCPSYGSYYKVGTYENPMEEFKKVINCALELHSNTIRIWAGIKGTKDSNNVYFNKVVMECQKLCDLASEVNLTISFEYHSNTLTDNASDTKKILKSINRKNIYTYWQPSVGKTINENCDDINKLIGNITNVHVFHWDIRKRLSLQEGIKAWEKYLSILCNSNRYYLLEFIKDNDINQYIKDSKTLKDLLNE
ncbi:MAG: sugar phosphate isomerase/epimerase [Clostridiales bacterium]|nr:sugar phosphate isomerase/epimerase [Clostridiales bacterium]